MMYEITLRGGPRERGRSQGNTFAPEIRRLIDECQTLWLGDMPKECVAAIRSNMLAYLQAFWPELIEELHGIAEGANLPFEDICTINFVSAIGALRPGCSNFITLVTPDGPVHGKTSDIGEDYRYYSVQRVIPDDGPSYLAVSWVGCLWAEVGINEEGYCVGQGSAPIMPDQDGYGVPTLEYPRALLSRCATTAQALDQCARLDMAGKGLNMAMVDVSGDATVVERSGTRQNIRRPVNGVLFCTNHFIAPEMQGMISLSGPGNPSMAVTSDSEHRLADLQAFFAVRPGPHCREDLMWLLRTQRASGGLCQDQPPSKVTHYAYLLVPQRREFWISQGKPWETEFVCHTL